MNWVAWVNQVAGQLSKEPWLLDNGVAVKTGRKLAYGSAILPCPEPEIRTISFATDLTVTEALPGGQWKPRVVVEAKLRSITTHDAITYSQKAAVHRSVHPYLRDGMMLLGDRKQYPLPGRLHRHGVHRQLTVK